MYDISLTFSSIDELFDSGGPSTVGGGPAIVGGGVPTYKVN